MALDEQMRKAIPDPIFPNPYFTQEEILELRATVTVQTFLNEHGLTSSLNRSGT
jgi:hypothetical protein